MVPPLGEYLTAFDTRFSRMRRILPRSASRVTSSTRTSRRTRCDSSVSCWFSSTCFTSGRRRNSVASRPTLEVCQALKDNRFSIMRCSLIPFSRRIAVTSRWLESSSPTAPSISSSVPSRMLARGVLSSCDMCRRKRLRSWASSSSRWRSHSSCPPRRSRSCGPVTAIVLVKVPWPSSLMARSSCRSGRPTPRVNTNTATTASGSSGAACHSRRLRACRVCSSSAATSVST